MKRQVIDDVKSAKFLVTTYLLKNFQTRGLNNKCKDVVKHFRSKRNIFWQTGTIDRRNLEKSKEKKRLEERD